MALIRRTYRSAGIVLLMVFIFTPDLHAQSSPFDPDISGQAALIGERVYALADRSLYITGERIRFMVRVSTSGLADREDWSKILYMELFSAAGSRHARGKFRIQNGTSSGELRIPDGLLTGNYYLRCYTRWMRNWDPSIYAYLPLRIINPFTPDQAEQVPSGSERIILQKMSFGEGDLKFSGPFSVARGEALSLDLKCTGAGGNHFVSGCISVVPEAALPMGPLEATSVPGMQGDEFQLNFLPDLLGVTLSGKVVDATGKEQGIMDSRVHFTMLGKQAAYSVARTDAYGYFAMNLPSREGMVEFLVQPEHSGDDAVEVRIDQDFDLRVYDPEIPDFGLSPAERELLIQMARKVQLSRIYGESPRGGNRTGAGGPCNARDPGSAGDPSGARDPSTTSDPSAASDSSLANDLLAFYGTPDFSLNMDEYVLLPTLEEVFINLVPSVTPFSRRNQTHLQIKSDNPSMSLFPPLMMVDQVPIFDLEQFLSIPPGKISHIHVVKDVYLKGDLRFGGIINLRSREGNMAGIDLPDHAFFIDYETLYPRSGDLPVQVSPEDKAPDYRNTLLWMPGVTIAGSASRTIDFMVPDYPGSYVVLFRGWDEAGKYISAQTIILVE